jgi:hypothetical protein
VVSRPTKRPKELVEIEKLFTGLAPKRKTDVKELINVLLDKKTTPLQVQRIRRSIGNTLKKDHTPAPSAYNRYHSSVYHDLKAQHPNATLGEISKLVGQGWKQLDKEESEKYKTGSKSVAHQRPVASKVRRQKSSAMKNRSP